MERLFSEEKNKDVEAPKRKQMMRFRLVSLFWILMVSTDAACSTDASLDGGEPRSLGGTTDSVLYILLVSALLKC